MVAINDVRFGEAVTVCTGLEPTASRFPLSDQLPKLNRMVPSFDCWNPSTLPLVSVVNGNCTMCLLPVGQMNVCMEVYGRPSTKKDAPFGTVPIIILLC